MERPSCTSSSTDKAQTHINQEEELGMIDLNTVHIFTKTSEISSHPPKLRNGLTQ